MDWIQGDKFKGLADFAYAPAERAYGDYDGLVNTLDLHAEMWREEGTEANQPIIYTHTMYLAQFLYEFRHARLRSILITHNCDINIDESFLCDNSITRWYAQNVNVAAPHIESIPIGVENDRRSAEMRKKEKMLAKMRDDRRTKNLLYINHDVRTNPGKREFIYPLFEEKPWVTAARGANGHDFDAYLDNVYNHKFVICPEGNGMDTHRVWECLYLGTIPIEKRNINNAFYEDMPVLLVDDWEEVTEDFLTRQWPALHGTRNAEKLTFEYWRNRIRPRTSP